MRLSTAAAVALQASACLAFPQPENLRKRDAAARAQAVKDIFEFSWNGYFTLAFPHDELHPVSNTPGDSRNGWGASAVDALSTAIIMELPDIVDVILTHITTIDFTTTATTVSMFETTIRYLGGMLAGYDLLNGPFADLPINRTNVPVLLSQAKTLGETLKFAFNTPTGIPNNDLDFTNMTFVNDGGSNIIAQIGTLVIEWTRLSDLLNDTSFSDLAIKGESFLLAPQPATDEPFPGLVGTSVSESTGLFEDASGGWSGGDDSFYEYLIKAFVYDPNRFSTYKDRWVLAADSTIANLTQHPSTRPGLTFPAEYSGTTLSSTSGHLTCFDGGNFILAGTVLGEQKYTDYGLQLVDGCHATYNSTATQIGPERFGWDPSQVPSGQEAFFEQNGFFITSSGSDYDLRPEVIESMYYAYRVTGNTMYQDWAWDAIVAINKTCRTESGFTAIMDVNNATGGGFFDNQESFWFAEVMKYSYIIHVADAEWQVAADGKNTFVFNTEAHPVKVFNPPTTTGNASQQTPGDQPGNQDATPTSTKQNAAVRKGTDIL